MLSVKFFIESSLDYIEKRNTRLKLCTINVLKYDDNQELTIYSKYLYISRICGLNYNDEFRNINIT